MQKTCWENQGYDILNKFQIFKKFNLNRNSPSPAYKNWLEKIGPKRKGPQAGLQAVTKYLAKSKKIKQNWTRLEYFDICFYVSFDCYCQKLIV